MEEVAPNDDAVECVEAPPPQPRAPSNPPTPTEGARRDLGTDEQQTSTAKQTDNLANMLSQALHTWRYSAQGLGTQGLQQCLTSQRWESVLNGNVVEWLHRQQYYFWCKHGKRGGGGGLEVEKKL